MVRTIIIIGIGLMVSFKSIGQQLEQFVFSVAGNVVNGGGTTVLFTCGETISGVTTLNGSTLFQGFQQPDKHKGLNATAISEKYLPDDLSYKVMIFPNPVEAKLTIEIKQITIGIKAKLIDIQGKVIHTNIFTGTTSEDQVIIDMTGLSQGIYYLIFTGGVTGLSNKSFKIIKN